MDVFQKTLLVNRILDLSNFWLFVSWFIALETDNCGF